MGMSPVAYSSWLSQSTILVRSVQVLALSGTTIMTGLRSWGSANNHLPHMAWCHHEREPRKKDTLIRELQYKMYKSMKTRYASFMGFSGVKSLPKESTFSSFCITFQNVIRWLVCTGSTRSKVTPTPLGFVTCRKQEKTQPPFQLIFNRKGVNSQIWDHMLSTTQSWRV